MEREKVDAYLSLCNQDQAPACVSNCPLGIDIRSLMNHAKAGNWAKAATLITAKTCFPTLVCKRCDRPCVAACVRRQIDEAVRIPAVMEACVHYGKPKNKLKIPYRKSEKRIAVVGGSLLSMILAAYLVEKGHSPAIFADQLLPGFDERDVAAGESILKEAEIPVMPPEEPMALAEKYDAVVLETLPDELSYPDGTAATKTFQTTKENVFALPTADGVFSRRLFAAKLLGVTLDRFVKKVSLTASRDGQWEMRESTLHVNLRDVESAAAVKTDACYTEEQLQAEANRCLECSCTECIKVCPYLQQTGHSPKENIVGISAELNKVVGYYQNKLQTLSCAQCGLCQKACPNGLDIGQFIGEIKAEYCQQGKLTPAYFELALRDMAQANSEACAIAKYPPNKTDCAYLFFPGCQLPGTLSDQTIRLYQDLLRLTDHGIGLFLGCCGVTARWAGETGLYTRVLEHIQKVWESMGKPVVVYACSACYKNLSEALPQIPAISVWELLLQKGFKAAAVGGVCALHDPCTSRNMPQVHDATRVLLQKCGCEIAELPYNREYTKCCGFGGLVGQTDVPVADAMVQSRLSETNEEIAVYCAMCREYFNAHGPRAKHILEYLYGEEKQPSFTFTQRQRRRVKFLADILDEVWGEIMEVQRPLVKLYMTDEIRRLIQKRMILESDLEEAIYAGEHQGTKLQDMESGSFYARHTPGYVTFWVEYRPMDDGFEVLDAYSHRLTITSTED